MQLEDVQMRVVGDEVRGVSVQRAEEKRDVVGVLGIVAEVEEFDQDESPVQCDCRKKAICRGLRSASFEQLFRILGDDVGGIEQDELAAFPSVEDFDAGARRIARMMRGEDHIRVENRARGHRLQVLGNFVVRAAQLLELRWTPKFGPGAKL